MIFPLSGLVLGALLGAVLAWRRGGNRLDLLQWAAVLGLIGAVIGLFILIYVARSYAGG